MTIWLLALLLLASLAGLGYRQGAIRVGISLIGILLGAALALPVGRLLRPLIGILGVKDPLWQWLLPPVIVFIIISLLAKAGAAVVHQKVDVFYKYRAGDLRLALWERLNQRLGLCLGLLNAVAYLVLIAFVVQAFSYWTFQVASGGEDPRSMRLLNRLGQDLQSTGFNRTAKSIDRMPDTFYDTADVVGLVYNNSLIEARLGSYPAFLRLAEQSEFQSLANDRTFIEMRQHGEPVFKVMNHPSMRTIVDNPDLVRKVWGILTPTLADLKTYLETGRTPKYESETILGRWEFNVNAAMGMVRRARPNISSSEMQKIKKWMLGAFEKTRLVVMTENEAIIKDLPQIRPPAGGPVSLPTPQTFTGQWKNVEPNKYTITFSEAGVDSASVVIEGDRLTIKSQGLDLVFSRPS